MANIRFNIDKKRDKSYIFVLYEYRPGCRFKMSLKEKVNPLFWDVSRQMVTNEHENHEFINNIIINVRKTLERCRLEAKSRQILPNPAEMKEMVTKIILPVQKAPERPVSNLSQSAYFKRFYEILPNYVNLQDAYENVESEWNDQGVQMFPTYGSFRVGKSRYFSGNKKSFNQRAKAI